MRGTGTNWISRLPVLWLLAAVSCAPASAGLKPSGASDTETACPGDRRTWNLRITDLRADRADSERVAALIRQSLSRSFPGCQWTTAPDAPTIAVEVHRFAVEFDETFEATVDWTVSARSASGQTLTEFDSTADVSRPNYRGSNNEREALQSALEQALKRTVTGLSNLPPVP